MRDEMRSICAVLFFVFSFIPLEANNIQVLKEGPIHESFVTQEFGNYILEVVPYQPPPNINEEPPPPQSETSGAIWIPGYWYWSRDEGDFIWVSGVWRKPPLHHHWIQGLWMNYQFGWVWLKGFWSKAVESELVYISEPPPDPLNENVPLPPSPADSYIWIPGYWDWQSDSQAYRWLSGRWSLIGQQLQYVPAQYYWREKGYFLVPGFWDWTLEERGAAFADISIAQEDRELIVFEPSVTLNSLQIVKKLFPYWPNYPCFFRFHFFYHPEIWISWGAMPPWWFWSTWWSFPVQDCWWLWWWWSHAGYPNPPWMTQELADSIRPPNDLSVKIMKDIKPPAIVTANGVVGYKELIEAIIKTSGKKEPILSSDPKQVEQIQDLADPRVPTPPYLRPNGKDKLTTEPKKPGSDVDLSRMRLHPGRVKLPSSYDDEQQREIFRSRTPKKQPKYTSARLLNSSDSGKSLPCFLFGILEDSSWLSPSASDAALQKIWPKLFSDSEEFKSRTGVENNSIAPPMHTPYYLNRTEQKNLTYTPTESPTPSALDTPKSLDTPEPQPTPKAPKTPKAPNTIHRGHTPYYYSPKSLRSSPNSPYSLPPPPPSVPPPHQGYDPSIHYEYPQPQMQTQHLDHLMTEPQPQENPAGLKAHPLPGDESTLPNF